MKHVVKRVLLALLPAIALPAAAAGNSVASVAVSRDGHVFFSDYIRNRIWEFTPGDGLRLRIRGKHTHHLDLGEDGTLYGEDVPPDRRWPSLWRMTPDGTVSDAGPATGAGPDGPYPGTVFLAGRDGGFEYLKECRLVRLSPDGRETPLAGNSCPERAWKEDALRYGHLHGSLVRGRDGAVWFSDARTVRRVGADGSVRTLAGRPVNLFADPQPHERRFDRVMGLAIDLHGNLFIADRKTRRIIRIAPGGGETIVATLGPLTSPSGLGIAGEDLYVVAESRLPVPPFLAGLTGNPRLIRISPAGRVTTVARVR
jgi:hypothetical protein